MDPSVATEESAQQPRERTEPGDGLGEGSYDPGDEFIDIRDREIRRADSG